MQTSKIIIAIIISVMSVNGLSTVNCDFEKIVSTYVCNPSSIDPISQENEDIEVNGTHLTSLKDDDVTYIRFNAPLTLQFVPTKLFETFENIEIFGLQNVNLTNLTTNAFTNCFKLKSLHIDGNKKLEAIPANFAENCASLENLYMPSNGIKVIDPDAFKGLDKLLYLVLTRNEIEELPENIFDSLGNLQHLFLDYNRIKLLSSDLFYPLRKLQLLSSTNNKIEQVSLQIFRNNPLLDQMFFDSNEIIAIDVKFFDEFPGQREDYEYRFNGNNCTSSIVSNKIDASTNFDEFEVCFKNWNETHENYRVDDEYSTAVTEFYSRDCRFFLNEKRKYTCVLENVNLVVTAISGAHYGDFCDLNVTQLFFFNSTLSRVPPIIFQKFPNLDFLSISSTQMTIINDQTFEECGQLTKIDASNNQIYRIVETALKKCKHLKTIDMSGNPIEFVDGEIFNYDPQLKHIILHKNF